VVLHGVRPTRKEGPDPVETGPQSFVLRPLSSVPFVGLSDLAYGTQIHNPTGIWLGFGIPGLACQIIGQLFPSA
jgi:hypothetical protein